MSFLTTLKKQQTYALLLTGSAIMGIWMTWRHKQQQQRERLTDQSNQIREGIIFPEWLSEEESAGVQGTIQAPGSNEPQTYVLYHPYIAVNMRDTCTPNHWHATYWLRFVAMVEQEPRRAIVQHTDTKRYHVMVQLPVEGPLPCDDCYAAPEVFRLPVRDHYAYFVFAPHQDLDGFTTVEHAQEAAQALPIPADLLELLPSSHIQSYLSEDE